MRRLISVFAVLIFLSPGLFAQSKLRNRNYIYLPITIPGAASTNVTGINDFGAVVGSFTDANGASHGFLIQNGQVTTLDFHSGTTTSTSTVANAINNAGVVTGYYYDPEGFPHAFTYDSQTQTFTVLPDFFPTREVKPFVNPAAINTAGQITGWYFPGVASIGFLVDQAGFHSLDALLGPSSPFNLEHEFPSGISDAGTIVGWGIQPALACLPQSFVITPDMSVSTFEVPGFCTLLRAISSSGSWLAGTVQSPDGSVSSGFSFNAGKVYAVQFPGATVTNVNGVNTFGVLVGTATINGSSQGFLAVPPRERRAIATF